MVITLLGCSSTLISYTPTTISTPIESTSFVEQVIYEQPNKHRPSYVAITKDYIGFDYGLSATSRITSSTFKTSENSAIETGVIKTKVREVNERYYFNSMNSPLLFKKRDWYIVQFIDKNKRSLKNIYTRNESKAKKLIDQINSLINNAS